MNQELSSATPITEQLNTVRFYGVKLNRLILNRCQIALNDQQTATTFAQAQQSLDQQGIGVLAFHDSIDDQPVTAFMTANILSALSSGNVPIALPYLLRPPVARLIEQINATQVSINPLLRQKDVRILRESDEANLTAILQRFAPTIIGQLTKKPENMLFNTWLSTLASELANHFTHTSITNITTPYHATFFTARATRVQAGDIHHPKRQVVTPTSVAILRSSRNNIVVGLFRPYPLTWELIARGPFSTYGLDDEQVTSLVNDHYAQVEQEMLSRIKTSLYATFTHWLAKRTFH